jgi:hypothetical protein
MTWDEEYELEPDDPDLAPLDDPDESSLPARPEDEEAMER